MVIVILGAHGLRDSLIISMRNNDEHSLDVKRWILPKC